MDGLNSEILNQVDQLQDSQSRNLKSLKSPQQRETDEDDNFPEAKMLRQQDSLLSNVDSKPNAQLKAIRTQL